MTLKRQAQQASQKKILSGAASLAGMLLVSRKAIRVAKVRWPKAPLY
jgi:hypothetical protein